MEEDGTCATPPTTRFTYSKFVRCTFVSRLCACLQIRFNEASTAAFGSNGYRADCRDIPFQEVLVVNEQGGQAWFKQKTSTPSTFKLSSTNYYTVGSALGSGLGMVWPRQHTTTSLVSVTRLEVYRLDCSSRGTRPCATKRATAGVMTWVPCISGRRLRYLGLQE